LTIAGDLSFASALPLITWGMFEVPQSNFDALSPNGIPKAAAIAKKGSKVIL
jgi:hypothetical protein